MYKYFTLILILSFSTISSASDLKIIKFDKKIDPQQFYLYGTSKGNYIVKNWQFNKLKSWQGKGEPKLSINMAIEIAKSYLNKKHKILVKEVTLRFAANANKEVVWYYYINFSRAPYKFKQQEYEVVVLTSGEIVAPRNPNLSMY